MYLATTTLIAAAIAAPLLPDPPVVRTVLPSGIHLIVSPRPNARLVAIEIRVRGAGSAHETPEENGLAHAVEHLLFKGTESTLPGAFDARFERMGGEAFAQTLRDGTAFRVCVFPEQWKDALTTWGELLQKPAFREADWTTERTVILREMNVAQGETTKLGLQTLATVAYPPGNLLRQPLMGSRANIERFIANDLSTFHAKRYRPANLTIAVSGPVTAEEVATVVSGQWGTSTVDGVSPPAPNPGGAGRDGTEASRSTGESTSPATSPAPPGLGAGGLTPSTGDISPTAPVRAPLFTDDEQTARRLATIYLGFPAPHLQTAPGDAVACDVLAAMLARGLGGILGERLSADKKLETISVHAEYQPQTDRALFVLHATGAKRDIGQIEDVIIEELENLKARCAAGDANVADLLEGAKSGALGEERFQRETVEGEAKYLAYLDMLNSPDGYAEKYAERVRAVTVADLTRLLENYITPKKRGVAVVGLSAIGGAPTPPAVTDTEAVQ